MYKVMASLNMNKAQRVTSSFKLSSSVEFFIGSCLLTLHSGPRQISQAWIRISKIPCVVRQIFTESTKLHKEFLKFEFPLEKFSSKNNDDSGRQSRIVIVVPDEFRMPGSEFQKFLVQFDRSSQNLQNYTRNF